LFKNNRKSRSGTT